MKLIYIAGKFHGTSNYEVQRNCDHAEDVGLKVAEIGGYPIIPHNNIRNFDKLLTDKFWLDGTLEILRRCDAVMLVPGWSKSIGALNERREAIKLNIPVFDNLDELKTWLAVQDKVSTDDPTN